MTYRDFCKIACASQLSTLTSAEYNRSLPNSWIKLVIGQVGN
jgi:hypothetical protein